MASYKWNKRFQLAWRKLLKMASWSRSSRPSQPNPLRPTSSDWADFCRASWKERPMAMTSPTAFIWSPSSRFAPLNLSKFHRGTFTTT